MIRLMVAAPSSGSGKTLVVCALLRALQQRGMDPCSFKCGPDYIDPLFHRAVLGISSCNLDLFLAPPTQVYTLFARYAAGHDAVVCEGVMGFYDGIGGTTDQASAWAVADLLDLPVVLVVRPKGASLTVAAQIKGLRDFRTPSHVAAVILNDCSPSSARSLAPVVEEETGVPVLGCLPSLPEAIIPSRHLGLYTAAEVADLDERVNRLAEALEASLDMDGFLELCQGYGSSPRTGETSWRDAKKTFDTSHSLRIGVAQDEAFCFIYPETLDAFRDQGAEIVSFSPLRDETLPSDIGGLYIPGGYPELYGSQLASHQALRNSIAEAVGDGVPTVAECGGFLYLGQSLEDEQGNVWPQCGVLPGAGFASKRLVRFGYGTLHAEEDSLLFEAGDEAPVHEFHYWDSTNTGRAFAMEKPMSHRQWRCGFASKSLYAAFPHLYFAGQPPITQRFLQAADTFRQGGHR